MVFFISSIMLKMVFVLVGFFLVGLTDAGQERVEVLDLVTNPTPMVLQSYSHSASNVAVSVDYQHLDGISSSVVMAESWLKTNVLTHYPAVQITTIVVGNSVLCNNTHEEQWDLVLPSMKNIYYSIVRWGLEKDIKVSAFLSTECLHPFSYTYREGLADRVIKPLLEFLQNTANSSVTLSVPSYYLPLVTAHRKSITKLGNFLESNEINVVISSSSKERKPKSRKLSFLSSSKVVVVDPFPARPTPLPKMPSSPLHSSIGFSVPAQIAKAPLPPLVQTPPTPLISDPYAPQSSTFPPSAQTSPPSPIPFPFAPQTAQPPSMYFSFGPESSPPLGIPSNPPDVEPYNPCYAPPTTTPVAPTPKPGQGSKGMWCVAKPSVPAEKLKEALDYACGVGGADCGEIKPQGSCYYPDTMVAHASYAFNSYWQKNKNKGGTCNFGGTAMVINANPSYQQCRFIIS